MIQAFVITLREGLEAFLIVAISLAYLRKTSRSELIPAIHWGIGASVLLSIGAGVLLSKARNQALWEGILGIVAAFLVASLTVHMWRAGRHMKKDIEGRRGVLGRLLLHPADDHARGDGDGDADERAAVPGQGDEHRRRGAGRNPGR